MTRPILTSNRLSAAALMASLATGGAALLAALLLVSPLSGCLNLSDGCMVDGVAPLNVQAQSGAGGVTITWEIPPFDTTAISNIWAVVKYDTAGGEAAQCNTYDPNKETPGCTQACEMTTESRCTIDGLKTGVTYTFTVITQTHKNPYCGNGTAFARTDAITISAP
jgi:hypothetical protein